MDHNTNLEALRATAHMAQADFDDEILDAVEKLLDEHNLLVGRDAEHTVTMDRANLAELVTSPAMLEALGFEKHWEWGHFPDGAHPADNEQQAHKRAARKPHIEGGYVRSIYTRATVQVPYDQSIADRELGRDLARRRAAAARDAAVREAEAAYQLALDDIG